MPARDRIRLRLFLAALGAFCLGATLAHAVPACRPDISIPTTANPTVEQTGPGEADSTFTGTFGCKPLVTGGNPCWYCVADRIDMVIPPRRVTVLGPFTDTFSVGCGSSDVLTYHHALSGLSVATYIYVADVYYASCAGGPLYKEYPFQFDITY